MTLLHEIPLQPITQRLSWPADMLTAHGGDEQRFLIGKEPRQSLAYRYLLDTEDDIQTSRARLLNDLDAELEVPIWFVRTFVGSVGAGATSILAEFSLWPPMVNATHDAIITDGTKHDVVTYDHAFDDELVLSSGLPRSYDRAILAPIQPGRIAGRPQIQRHALGAARMELAIDLTEQRPLAEFVFDTLHKDRPLVEERPLADPTADEAFAWNFGRVESVNAFEQFTGWSRASIAEPRRFATSDLLYWYRLLTIARGPLNSWFLPTYRRDLVLESQPAADATTITVKDTPVNYVDNYWQSPSHKSIYLDTDAGFLAREVTDAADNGDGTITLTLGTSLPGTVVIDRISLLEQVRIVGEVTLEHHARHSFVDLAVRTSQGGSADSGSIGVEDPNASGEEVFTDSESNWSPPEGSKPPYHFEVLAGGGGSSSNTNQAAIAGCGGGEYAITTLQSPSFPVSVTVGQGGGDSSVVDSASSTIVLANHGLEGGGDAGAGGSGGIGDTVHSGGSGGEQDGFLGAGGGGGAAGWRDGAGADGQRGDSGTGGVGGSGTVGAGGDGGDDAGDAGVDDSEGLGHDGSAYGGGGGGKGETTSGAINTGRGFQGICIVTWGKSQPDYVPTGNEA